MQFLKRQWKQKHETEEVISPSWCDSALIHCLFKMSPKALIFSYLPGPLGSVTSKSMSCLVSVASVAMVTAHLGCGERRRKWACGCCYHLYCRGVKGASVSVSSGEKRGETHAAVGLHVLAFLLCSPSPVALSSKSSALCALAEWLLVTGLSGAR